jgi:hypothetical protein
MYMMRVQGLVTVNALTELLLNFAGSADSAKHALLFLWD